MRWILQCLVLASVMLLTSCSGSDSVRIAMHHWLGYQTLPVAVNMGWIHRDLLTITTTPSATESMQLMREGKVDAAALTLDEAIQLSSEGVNVAVIMAFDISSGADVVLSRYDSATLKQMSHITIGLEKNALGSLMLAKLIEQSGLDQDKFIISNIPADQHLDFWQQQQPDMLITYEPMAATLIQQGAIRFMDTREIADTVFDVLVVNRSFAETHRDALAAIIRGQFIAVSNLMTQPDDTIYRLAQEAGMESSEVRQTLRGLILPGAGYNARLMQGEPSHLQATATALSRLLYRQGMIGNELHGPALVMPDILLHVYHSMPEQ
ncbi:hypothetical protein FE236_12570 [Mariprofundus erugo]|nr:hypothetical protein FE236_12570 [Mariprofundus erugo]